MHDHLTTANSGPIQPRSRPRRTLALVIGFAAFIAACSSSVTVTSANSATVQRTPAPEPTPLVEAADEDPPAAEPTATVEPSPTPLTPGVLTVNDTEAVGVIGDELLSLVEAVQLANGILDKDQLSAAEGVFVSGDPGPDVADTINVEIGLGGQILLPGGNVWIVELFGNDGDTLNGGGATITGAAQSDGISHNVMLIGSADVTIRQFSFSDVTAAIGIESASRELAGITIEKNAFTNVAVRDITLQNSVTGGVLDNVTISENAFDATERLTDFHAFVTVRGASAIEGQTTQDTSVNGLTIQNNSMTAAPDSTETCISLAAGNVEFGVQGQVSGAVVDGVIVADNTMSGCGTAIALAGGLVNQTNGTSIDNAVRAVVVSGNTVTVARTGLAIHGAFVKPVPEGFQFSTPVEAQLNGSIVEDVSLESNVWSAINTVVRIVGGEFAVPGTGLADANSVDALTGGPLAADDFGELCEEIPDQGPLASANTLGASCAALEPT